ncbi:MAG: hypothetical protein K6G67_08675 [Lachnospiraceae bacterium]|nr:hypothetical protein [Lachnospiraceae bacterium]
MKRTTGSIAYDYIDPTGNITILVTTPVEESERARIASEIMKDERECEQVGYVIGRNNEGIDIAMAAGEFCGNAVMSAAALYCDDRGMGSGEEKIVKVNCTGCDHTLSVYITQESNHVYGGRVTMPIPVKISEHKFEYDNNTYTLPLAEFDGISHVIATADELPLADEDIENAARKWCTDLGADCAGIMLMQKNDENEADDAGEGVYRTVIRPVVYAPSVGTCYWESSCASGTTASFVYLAGKMNIKRLVAKEPGGVLEVSYDDSGSPVLEGHVRL